jgi:hypothetical protein
MSASAPGPQRAVIVAGDVTMDWNIARTRRRQATEEWNPDDLSRADLQPAGALLAGTLIESIAARIGNGQGPKWTVHQAVTPEIPVIPGDDRYQHSYAIWSQFPYEVGKPDESPAWRVEEFLGLDRAGRPAQASTDLPSADLVVLDDANLGFRDQAEWALPERRSDGRARWILLKMAAPVADPDSRLWQELHDHWTDRLVVVVTIDDLRPSDVQVSRELSWERTAQDLAWELIYNPRVNALSRCAHVVVSIGPDGAVVRSGGTFTLLFDPLGIEGGWAARHEGGMIGYTSCLTAGLAREIMLAPEGPDIVRGARHGLSAMRTLHLEGYADRKAAPGAMRLSFPADLVVATLFAEPEPGKEEFFEIGIPDHSLPKEPEGSATEPGPPPKIWTILETTKPMGLAPVAEQIVLEGAKAALPGVPMGQFGDLLAVDRREIESFRAIAAAVGEYWRQEQKKRPLSVAVFGAPGSGKSFAIEQIATSLLPGQTKKLTFNVSQFGGADDLVDALHQVRDVGLSGKLPLVFWDEFDTSFGEQRLGWLRHFLSPMQDGSFQQGQVVHPIGPAIFVFAGGTAWRMGEFGKGKDMPDGKFRGVKGPDFVSRLKGYVDILGPNRSDQRPAEDPYYIIRRAILLRSVLERSVSPLFHKKDGKNVLDIDQGVLRAFLKIRKYEHGARSMESIVSISLLSGKTRFDRSSLPSEAQLAIHVDGAEFMALVHQMQLPKELLERLAAETHAVYVKQKKRDGYTYGPVRDNEKKTTPLLVPYDELPEQFEQFKEQNRRAVRTIPDKLAAAGYVMVPAKSGEPPAKFAEDEVQTMARLEHELWMQMMVAEGWTAGEPTEENPKRNPSIVPWEKLGDDVKQYDIDQVEQIPRILAAAGYTVTKIGSPDF